MKENKYDEDSFFGKYSSMLRSTNGLKGAGEWAVLRNMLPNFENKRVLDLGCGFGWHCRYAMEQGAKSVVGIDISKKMINEAKTKNGIAGIEYICIPIEDYAFELESFDIVISSLAFHYLESFSFICNKVYQCLARKGVFIFSVEHPIFTSGVDQEWSLDKNGNRLNWPIDNYFIEGAVTTSFLGEKVIKYHKTLTTYVENLIRVGFEITGLSEPEPDEEILSLIPESIDEKRRPMFLIISSVKKDYL